MSYYILILILLSLSVLVVFFKTLSFQSHQRETLEKINSVEDFRIEYLQRAVTFQTISHQEGEENGEEFLAFHQYLKEAFPLVDRDLHREVVNGKSLLFRWEGKKRENLPLLLLAHMDVVPAEEDKEWSHPPFAGEVKEGYLYGRGTLDNKGNLIAQLQAVESLLKQNYTPETTIYLAFGHDEEIGGKRGAAQIAALLKERGVELGLVLDEGGAVMEGLFPSLKSPLALVGVAEKGYMTLELKIETQGGHSATPPRETTIGILSKALSQLERCQPQIVLDDLAWKMLNRLGPSLPLSQRMVLANPWLFKGLLKRILDKSQNGSLFRTTIVPTIISSGIKENVIPAKARSVVNCRLYPGDTLESVEAYVKRVINDSRIQVQIGTGTLKKDPSPISPTQGAFTFLEEMIGQFFPNALIAPYLVIGATDSRYFREITSNIYRFSPFTMKKEDMESIHGKDERIHLHEYNRGVSFYQELIRAYCGEESRIG